MKRCVIVGGADINNYEYIKSCLRNDDFIVFCDSGLKHLESLQVNPGLIVGDFDSHDNPHLGVETIVLPCEKDDTDNLAFAVANNLSISVSPKQKMCHQRFPENERCHFRIRLIMKNPVQRMVDRFFLSAVIGVFIQMKRQTRDGFR